MSDCTLNRSVSCHACELHGLTFKGLLILSALELSDLSPHILSAVVGPGRPLVALNGHTHTCPHTSPFRTSPFSATSPLFSAHIKSSSFHGTFAGYFASAWWLFCSMLILSDPAIQDGILSCHDRSWVCLTHAGVVCPPWVEAMFPLHTPQRWAHRGQLWNADWPVGFFPPWCTNIN